MSETRKAEFTLRPYDAGRDAARVEAIVGEIWGGGDDALMEEQFGLQGGQPWSEWTSAAVLRYIGEPDCRAFVAEQDGNIIGFCSYIVDEVRKRGTVGYNGVALSHQGLGIGTAMLDFVMERFPEEGMEYAGVIVMDNEAHAPARRNYEKHGFRPLAGFHYLVQKL